jgi:putative ABC transport system permease protein
MFTSFALAFATISRNRLRAGLTVLGILIGVAALIAVTALALGVSEKVSGSLATFAANALTISPESPPSGKKQTVARKLTESDGRAIAQLRSVALVTPMLANRVQVIYADKNESAVAMGTTTAWFAIRQAKLARGSLWTAGEETRKEKVCVVGTTLAKRLFGETDPVGRSLRIGRAPCRVLGVLASLGANASNDDLDNLVLMPIGTFRAKLRPTSPGRVDGLMATAQASSERAKTEVTALLRQRHRVHDEAPSDFAVSSPDALETLQLAIAAALSALLVCVAGVSLLVGGIGVMNIMLVSVAERTREIGIRLSVGARSGDILAQFMVEAVVLSLAGGVLGLLFGSLMTVGIGAAVSLELTPSPLAAVIAIVSSGTIGVVFGILPARRASRLDPIQALRSD